ncbi:hypothetical protein AMJ47_01530 [Parcubacteria bacterium DG_72]|nr:MAG: hypothetical protein AMJ47_01530 [Parcubacteria bacterium DG_72]
MLTKKEAKRLVRETKGEARGVALKDDLDYILEIKGEEGLERVEQRMAELGYPLRKKDIKPMSFYPMGLANLFLLVIKEVFNFTEKDLEDWGASIVKFSLFTKIFLRYFGSLALIAKEAPKIWRDHYTIGDLEMPEYSEKKKYVILRLKNFKMDPIHCSILTGMFSKISQMVVKHPATCKETKCMAKGDSYHELLITW